MLAISGASVWLLALHGPCGRGLVFWPGVLVHMTSQQKPPRRSSVSENRAEGGLHSPQTSLPASRSCTTRTATGMRAASAVPSATSRWLRSPSAPGMTARSCAASAEPERTGTAARAVTRWSCQVSFLASSFLPWPVLHLLFTFISHSFPLLLDLWHFCM